MPYPDIVFNNRYARGASRRIPYRFSNTIDTMIVTANECDVVCDQDMIAEANVALNYTARPQLNPVSEFDDPVWSPDRHAPRNSE